MADEAKGINGGLGLQPHEVRVVEERMELNEKITKLHAFMNSDFYQTLSSVSHKHFEEQEKAMIEYSEILLKRINLFEGKMENTIRLLTFGEEAVGLSFNPSNLPRVDEAKKLMARAIDLLEEEHSEKTDKGPAMSSWTRNVLRTAAFNAIIAGQMALVKYLTWSK